MKDNFEKQRPLTPRETEVIFWASKGKISQDIASILGIGETTIIYHMENIRNKLNAMNKAHAVSIALEQGLIGK